MPAFAARLEKAKKPAPGRPAAPAAATPARDAAWIPLYTLALGAIQRRRATSAGGASEHGADAAGEHAAPSIVHEVLRSPGARLDPEARATMERGFGRDFGQVRVHTDARAGESAAAVGADAYTVGSDVVFARGTFAPGTVEGHRLLAHELAHVVQQSGSRRGGTLSLAPADSGAEREAAAAGSAVARGSARPPSMAPALTRAPVRVHRQPQKYPGVADLTVKTTAIGGSTIESTVSVKVASAAEEKEARDIIQHLQFRYEVRLDSKKSLDAVQSTIKGDPMDRAVNMDEALLNRPPRPLKDVITTSAWDLPQLRALKESMAFFDTRIGGLPRGMAGFAFGRVNVGINDAGDARDPKVLGQNHGGKSSITLFDAASGAATPLQDKTKALTGTLVHELAHAIMGGPDTYIAAMSPAYWTDPTTRSGNAGAEAPITPYGDKSASEDLAEATMFYFLEPATLQAKCPQRFKYVDKQVKSWKAPSPSPSPSP